jgi:hypothetical protein
VNSLATVWVLLLTTSLALLVRSTILCGMLGHDASIAAFGVAWAMTRRELSIIIYEGVSCAFSTVVSSFQRCFELYLLAAAR